MRTPFIRLTGVLVLGLIAGCTQKVEPPSLAGPSTLARAISITANKHTLFQNGIDFVELTVTSTSPTGQPQTIPLRAEIMVGGVIQDFGTLSTKNPVTPTTMRYTAPNASPNPAGQVAQEVTIIVTPTDSGDFRAEVARQVNLRLVPQGVILPSNPNLTAAFSVVPASPQAFSTATFDASASTNMGVACLAACTYAWNFGDGTTGTGMVTAHEFRTVGAVQVSLTVTDARGAENTVVRSVTVAASTPPSASFLMSPTPVGINQDVFFNAEQSRATLPRRIVSYGWNFGDGRTGTGVTTARSFSSVGTYTVVLTVTDDAGAIGQSTQSLSVTAANAGMNALFTISPTAPLTTATTIFFNASASTSTNPIVEYRFNYGDGTPDDVGTAPTQTHRFTAPGTYVVRLTIRDSLGRTATSTVSVTIT